MQQLTLTIGRGNDERPNKLGKGRLPDGTWATFVAAARAFVLVRGYEIVVDNAGTGSWDGVTEDNHVVIGVREHTRDATRRIPTLTAARALAEWFGQESVAVGFGTSYLVSNSALRAQEEEEA